MTNATESGEFASSGQLANPALRNTAFVNLEKLNLPEESRNKDITFVTARPDGWRFCSSIVFRKREDIAPTEDECIDKIPAIFRGEVCGIKNPTAVKPVFCAGEFIFLIDLYRGPALLS